MHALKLSISLPKQQCDFIESYQSEHHCKTQSEVIEQALTLLQQAQLEAHYRAANKEIEADFYDGSINLAFGLWSDNPKVMDVEDFVKTLRAPRRYGTD